MKIEISRLIDALPGLIWTVDSDGRAEFVNQRWRQYTGLSVAEALGLGWLTAIHPDDATGFQCAWDAILASGIAGEIEARLRRADGEHRWFTFRIAPLAGESGDPPRWCGIASCADGAVPDLHEVTLLEMVARGRPLAEVLETLCHLVEEISAGCFCSILVVDVAKACFRLGAGPSLPPSYNAILDGTAIDPTYSSCSLAAVSKAPVIAADVANDPRWASSSWPALMAEHGLVSCCSTPILSAREQVLGVFSVYRREAVSPTVRERELIGRFNKVAGISIERALTDAALQASEAELNKARAELTHVARVMTLSALTASIAHEVNQPLSGIVTNASTCLRMLAADPPNLEGARATAQRTLRDGNRASEVIHRLRALFARKQPVSEPVDLNDAAREVLALSSSELQRNRVFVHTEFDDDLPLARGDRVQLQQVILNLILNAADAMKTTDNHLREAVVATSRDDVNNVMLSVRDAGVGIDPRKIDRLFEAFYTTKNEGMGIGLSISRSIIESHKGRIWATTNNHEPGATFGFSIPC